MFASAGFNLSVTPRHVQPIVTVHVLNMSINNDHRKIETSTTQNNKNEWGGTYSRGRPWAQESAYLMYLPQRWWLFLFLLPRWRQESYVRALRPTPSFTWRRAPHSCARTCIFMEASVSAFMCLWTLQDWKCCWCKSECIGTSSPGSPGILRFQSFCLNRFVVQLRPRRSPALFHCLWWPDTPSHFYLCEDCHRHKGLPSSIP